MSIEQKDLLLPGPPYTEEDVRYSLPIRHQQAYGVGVLVADELCLPRHATAQFKIDHGGRQYLIRMGRIDGLLADSVIEVGPEHPTTLLHTGLRVTPNLWQLGEPPRTILPQLKAVIGEGQYTESKIGFYDVDPIYEAINFAGSVIDRSKVLSRVDYGEWQYFRGYSCLLDDQMREKKRQELINAGIPAEKLFAIMYPLELLGVIIDNCRMPAGELARIMKMSRQERDNFYYDSKWFTRGPSLAEIEKFIKAKKPVHNTILQAVAEFEKIKDKYEKELQETYINYAGMTARDSSKVRREIARIEAGYQQARLAMRRQVNRALWEALDPILSPTQKAQRKQDEEERARTQAEREAEEIRSKPTLAALKTIEKVTGGESVQELNAIAAEINTYFRNLTVADILEEREIFELEEEDEKDLAKYSGLRVADLHRIVREGILSEVREKVAIIAGLFRRVDVFEPLMRYLAGSFTDVSVRRAGSLMYLFYQLDNPFMGPTRTAREIVNQAQSLYRQWDEKRIPASQEVLERITRMVDEFVLTARSWKSAWTYFGAENAQEFNNMLTDLVYGPLLFSDLVHFAKRDLLICPAQIFSFARQLSGLVGTDLVTVLKKLYDQGSNLKELAAENGITYQITGLQRAEEYGDYLAGWVDKEWQDRIVLSLGGGLGLIEARRAKLFGLTGPTVVIDMYSLEELLARSLVIRNEFRYSLGDPCLTEEEIHAVWAGSPSRLTFINAVLPLSPKEIRDLITSHEIDPNLPVGIIFDQRASALYLSGEDFLASIRSSLQLLAKEGGLYVCTKGWANKLLVDQVARVNVEEGKEPMVSMHLLHHTNSFFSSGHTIINGKLEPAAIFFAEGGTRYIRTADEAISPASFQPGRAAEDLGRQQEIMSIGLIAEIFSDTHPNLLLYPPVGWYGREFAVAYAYLRGLPLSIPSILSENLRPAYRVIIEHLARLIESYIVDPSGLKDANLEFNTEGCPKELLNFADAVNAFISLAQRSPDILSEPIGDIERLLQESRQVAIVPSEVLPVVEEAYLSTQTDFGPEESRNAQAEEFSRLFHDRFLAKFLVPGEGLAFDHVVANAILELVGSPKRPLPSIGSYSEFKRAVLDKDYEAILMEIKRKIALLNRGRKYTMDFSTVANPDYFWNLIRILERTDRNEELWQEILSFIEQHLDVRTFQAV